MASSAAAAALPRCCALHLTMQAEVLLICKLCTAACMPVMAWLLMLILDCHACSAVALGMLGAELHSFSAPLWQLEPTVMVHSGEPAELPSC